MYKSEEKINHRLAALVYCNFYMLQTKVEITGRAEEFETLPKLEKQKI